MNRLRTDPNRLALRIVSLAVAELADGSENIQPLRHLDSDQDIRIKRRNQ